MGRRNEEDLRRRYKVLLANPPFAGTLPKDSIREDLPTHSKKSELLFLAAMMKCLTVSDEDPAELIRELLQVEQEITIGLEQLLKEVES